jgi:hypothetical protein
MGLLGDGIIDTDTPATQFHPIGRTESFGRFIHVVEFDKGKAFGVAFLVRDEGNVLDFAKLFKNVTEFCVARVLRQAKHAQHVAGVGGRLQG